MIAKGEYVIGDLTDGHVACMGKKAFEIPTTKDRKGGKGHL